MTQIKTDFIKRETQKFHFKKKQYISDLIKIERCANGDISGWMQGYLMNYLKQKYPQEWAKIWQEVKDKTTKKQSTTKIQITNFK